MYRHLLAATVTLLGLAAAQVHTDCSPLEKECPPDPAFGTDHTFGFNSTPNANLWETTAGAVQYSADNGAAFTINKSGDSPTLRSKFYFFFGRTEIWVKVAHGKGIISSMMWLSDVLDEVDWEFIGSNNTHATTNYFGKGNNNFMNGGSHPMTGMHDDFHNYTTVWTKDQIDWFIDGNRVRTLTAQAANKTLNYPQTPMRLSVGIWAAGDPSMPKGTRDWAGGDADYSKGPYTMYMKSCQVTDFSSGKQYVYGDHSGKWESIKEVAGNSTALKALTEESTPPKSPSQSWNDMPQGAKIGVYAGGGCAAIGLMSVLIWYFIRQRRIGAAEAKSAEERSEAEKKEIAALEKNGINPDGFAEHGQEYRAGKSEEMRHDQDIDDSYHVPETPMGGPLEGGRSWAASAAGPSGAAGMAGVGVAAGAVGAGMMNKGPQSRDPNGQYQMNQGRGNPGPDSAHGFNFGVPAAAGMANRGPNSDMQRSQSPALSMQSQQTRLGSPGPAQAYGVPPNRMQSPGPAQGYGAPVNRMQSPGPAQGYGAPQNRMQNPGPAQGYGSPQNKMQNQGPGQGYGSPPNRMQSPGPAQGYGAPQNRMQSPGPGQGYGGPPNRMQSPGPAQAYGVPQNRMQSPAPGPMSPTRSYTGGSQPGYRPPQQGGYHHPGAY